MRLNEHFPASSFLASYQGINHIKRISRIKDWSRVAQISACRCFYVSNVWSVLRVNSQIGKHGWTVKKKKKKWMSDPSDADDTKSQSVSEKSKWICLLAYSSGKKSSQLENRLGDICRWSDSFSDGSELKERKQINILESRLLHIRNSCKQSGCEWRPPVRARLHFLQAQNNVSFPLCGPTTTKHL